MRRYLSRPEGSYGPVDPGKLAALAGRELPAILHAFPELAHADPRPVARRYTGADIQRNHAALDGLHGHIGAMITASPQITIAAIWERLADEHSTTVAYPTLRAYVTSRRFPDRRGSQRSRKAASGE